MKTVITINRAKWRTGDISTNKTGFGSTRLLNPEGYKCCLGFICSIKKKKIKHFSSPGSIDFYVEDLNEKSNISGRYENTALSLQAMNINDKHDITPKEKEKLLKKLFKNSKYTLKFVGKYTQ